MVARAMRAISTAICGWLRPCTLGYFLCSCKESNQRKHARLMARHLPALRASVSAVARQDIPVLAGDQRGPSRCRAGARPEAGDARARHTGLQAKPGCASTIRGLRLDSRGEKTKYLRRDRNQISKLNISPEFVHPCSKKMT